MRPPLRACLLLVATLLLALPPLARAQQLELVLTFVQTQTPAPGTVARDDQPAASERREGRLIAQLGIDGMTVAEGESDRRIYDFATGRLITEDASTGTFTGQPLVAVVGDIEAEVKNRLFLRDVLAKAEVTSAAARFEPRAIELELGLRVEQAGPAKVTARIEQERTILEVDGSPVASYTPSEHTLPEALRPSFERFLLYELWLHPDLAARLALGSLPATLEVSRPNPAGTTSTQWRLARIAPLTAPPARTSSLERTYAVPDALKPAFRRATELASSHGCPGREQILMSARSFAAAGNHLEAFLELLELHLGAGTEVPSDLLQAIVADAGAMSPLTGYLPCLSEKDPAAAIPCHERFLQAAGAHRHLVEIFLANRHAELGHVDIAVPLLVDALSANPCVTGAWKDLGGLLLDPYDGAAAWECWDLALALVPDHPMLASIREAKRTLQERYPERF